jgi:Rrf2 family protein
MRLQTSTMLAIFAVLELAGHGGRSVAGIADKFGVSSHHLAKVMNELARAGLVEAARGAGGGYQFVANPRRTTLYDVVRLFETVETERPDGAALPEQRALAQVLHEIDEIAAATLGSITIGTMCKLVDAVRNKKRERIPA